VLTAKNGELILEDCSRNGTYVNGQPVNRINLLARDQIQIGRSIIKVVFSENAPGVPRWVIGGTQPRPAEAAAPTVRPTQTAPARAAVLAPAQRRAPAPARTAPTEHLRGSLADIALPDLIQLLTGSRKSGMLVLRGAQGVGRIHLDKGHVCYAAIDEIESGCAAKVFYRLMRWTEGTFELEPPDGRQFDKSITENVEYLLLEAMHQLDEINNLGTDLPPLCAEVALTNPLPAPLRTLSPGDLDFIQLVLRHKLVSAILDHYAGSDFEAYTYLKSLIGRKYLVVTGG
jgi:hypothetical protein